METIVRAPSKGILLQRLVNSGDPVVPLTSYQAGTELATLADMNDLIFKGTVDEIDVGKLEINMPVRIKIGALPDHTVTGRLSKIAPQATEKDNAKLFEVEIELIRSRMWSFGPGTCQCRYCGTQKKGILIIPDALSYLKIMAQRPL
jgi:HlyD family secretion protein